MIHVYRIVYFILKNILKTLKPFLSASIRSWIELREKKIEKNNQFTSTYWFHTSSGEIEYCKSVIRLLREKQPNAQIVVTYSSPSAEKLFHNISEAVDQFIPICWDQPGRVNELLDYINPHVLVFSRTDIWPELVEQSHSRNIKMAVISFLPKFNFISILVYYYLLPKFILISCTNEDCKNKLQDNFENLNIFADGDTRFDQVYHRLSEPSKIIFLKNSHKVFVFGSTWPEDEVVVFKTFSELIKNDFKIILSPHEVSKESLSSLQNRLNKMNLSFSRLSKATDLKSVELTTNVFLIDKIGYLADCYRFADLAFVGGSFKEKIHSVMEPLCCGLPVLSGPYFANNPEAKKYLGRFFFSVKDDQEFLQVLPNVLRLEKNIILNELKHNKNASLKVLERLMRL
jgi:3-deoxy-D-manno-octulosonic-acid transferase